MVQVYDNIRFYAGKLDVDKLISKAERLIENQTPENIEKTNKKIAKIASRLEVWNKSWLNFTGEDLSEKILKIEFKAKESCPGYDLKSSIGKQVFKRANKIVDSSVVQEKDIYQNPEEFYYLSDKERHLYKQITRHEKNWGNTDVKIGKAEDGAIAFHSGEKVADIKKAEQENPANLFVVAAERLKPAVQKDPESGKIVLEPIFQRSENATYKKAAKDPTTGEVVKDPATGEIVMTEKNFEAGKYYVSLVSSKPSPHLTPIGHHTWLRLTDDHGKVSTVGKWPAQEQIRFVANIDPEFQAPETHEWIDSKDYIFEEVIEITREQYEGLKHSIEADMNNASSPDNTYNTVLKNCADWALETLENNGIIDRLDAKCPNEKKKLKVNIFRALLPTSLNVMVDKINESSGLKFLKVVLAVIALPFKLILRPFIRGFLLILGASSKRKEDKFVLIGSLWDFLWKDVLDVTHPLPLQKYAQENFPSRSKECEKGYANNSVELVYTPRKHTNLTCRLLVGRAKYHTNPGRAAAACA